MFFAYDIPEPGHVGIEVFDLKGRKILTLINSEHQPGSFQVLWNGLDDEGGQVASGTYIYLIRCGDYEKRMKVVFLI